MEHGLRLAIVVDPSLSIGHLANTVAAIGIGIGAAKTELGCTYLTDASGLQVLTSANRPIPILQAPPETIGLLLGRALDTIDTGVVVPFPRFARSLHRFEDYLEEFPRRDLSTEIIDGFGIAGSDKWVRSLTGSLRLLR